MSDGAKDAISDGLAGALTPDQIRILMEETLAITKDAWGNCPHCKRKVKVPVNDAKAVSGAIRDLATLVWSKPKDEAREDAGVTFIRTIVREEPEPPAAA